VSGKMNFLMINDICKSLLILTLASERYAN